MSLVSLIAIYFVVWWVVLFIVLPFGVRTAEESSDVVLGTVRSAPVRPMLVRKAIATSILAAVVVAAIWYVKVEMGIDLETLGRWFASGNRR